MPRPISRLTGAALAATGVCLSIAALVAVLVLSPLSSTAAASTPPARATAATAASPLARPAATTTISARHTSVGTILLGPGGETLYAFTRDSRNHDACASVHGCLSVWPPATVQGHLAAAHGVRSSLLSSITVHGARQITYAGHPLYRFVESSGPADTSYVGTSEFGGTWPALSAAGQLVR